MLHKMELGPYMRNSADRARYLTRPPTEFVDRAPEK